MNVNDMMNKQQKEYLDLANTHLEHDLSQSDREALKHAATQLGSHTWIGGFVGTGLGIALAFRGRANMHRAFLTMKNAPKPSEVIMETGEHVKVPKEYMNSLKEPGPLSTFFSTFFLGSLGLIVGSNIGMLTGSYAAKKTVQNEADLARLKNAYRLFRIDLLKKELADMEGGKTKEIAVPFLS